MKNKSKFLTCKKKPPIIIILSEFLLLNLTEIVCNSVKNKITSLVSTSTSGKGYISSCLTTIGFFL